MRIALPLTATDAFSPHYGAARKFVVFEVDPGRRVVRRRVVVAPEASEPCGWAPLLRAAGADLVLAAGMGGGAQARMAEHGIRVLAGVVPAEPETLVAAWLAGSLPTGENRCAGGHGGYGGCDGHPDHDHEPVHRPAGSGPASLP